MTELLRLPNAQPASQLSNGKATSPAENHRMFSEIARPTTPKAKGGTRDGWPASLGVALPAITRKNR